MTRRGKKYLDVAQKVERTEVHSPQRAIELAKEVSYTKFDGTIELHIRTGLDPRRADEQIRGMVQLPHGLGKTVKVVVFASAESAAAAEAAGADYVFSSDEDIKRIMDGWTDFDVAIAVPEMMPKVGRLGRVLGPRGLMPNPKTGTVVQADDLGRAVREAKAGRVEYRLDRTGNLHMPIGKVSFPVEQLLGNLAAIMDTLRRVRPPQINKTRYMRRMTLAPTMGPGIKVDPMAALELESPV